MTVSDLEIIWFYWRFCKYYNWA